MTFKPTETAPNLLYHVWFEKLGFCGCSSPETVLPKIRDALRAEQAISEAHRSDVECYPMGKATPAMAALHAAEQKALGPDRADYYLMAYTLARADLTEHGGSVPGWPSDLGLELLAYLETHTEEEWSADLEGILGEGGP